MLKMTRDEIIELYKSGGWLCESAPFHDFWRYLPDYKPSYESGGSMARMIEPEIPRQMKKDGEIGIAYADSYTKMYYYKLMLQEEKNETLTRKPKI